MTAVFQKRLTLFAIIGLLYWFFGNLYETIVISPNWVMDSPTQMKRLNEFFVLTSPTLYFVPITQIATIVVWIIWGRNKIDTVKRELKWAGIFSILATILNVVIVSTVVLKLFARDFEKYGEYLTTLTWRWNILNFFRMVLVGTTIYFLFNVYRKLDRM